MSRLFLIASIFLLGSLPLAYAQTGAMIRTTGALVIVPAHGEVRHPNDEARISFMVEEQDKDRVAAVNRVNQRMKQGTDVIKREDPQARLETRGYFTYPIYSDEGVPPRAQQKPQPPQRQLVGWRVGQYLEVTTTNIDTLPRTVAAAQRLLSLNGLQFGLSNATSKKLEEQRIAAAYANLVDRIGSIARAMGRNPSDAVLETIDFEGSGNYSPEHEAQATRMLSAKAMDSTPVEEPGFEPGETTLNMRVVGRVRFQ